MLTKFLVGGSLGASDADLVEPAKEGGEDESVFESNDDEGRHAAHSSASHSTSRSSRSFGLSGIFMRRFICAKR